MIYNKSSIGDKWHTIVQSWTMYKQDPAKPDSLVHLLIMLDSFITYINELHFDEAVIIVKKALHVIEQCSDSFSAHQVEADELIIKISSLIKDSKDMNTFNSIQHSSSPNETSKQLIILCWSNTDEVEELAAQMEHYGYDTLITDSPSKMAKLALSKNASMVVLDRSTETIESIEIFITDLNNASIPWIAVSDIGSFSERLEMVRLKVSTFLTKPITAASLVDVIDKRINLLLDEPFRVMIADDSGIGTNELALFLSQYDIGTILVTDMSQILTSMHEFSPDLILLDIKQSFCSGIEVAQIIRQHEHYMSIPIIYLSDTHNKYVQYEAIRLGGDDFLIKPIDKEHLLAIIVNKIERYRTLRQYMVQDSLTGLLNHTRIKQHLAQAVLLARREKTPLSFAMLDIDHFKKVNDQYGHPVGDRVIKSLAQLLRQRVRRSDVVGRYGGEEFAVVLHGATSDDAYNIMDRIRKDFSTIYHPYDNGIFGSTFSCGIAGLPMFDDPNIIATKADAALYISKNEGRNKVTIFGKKRPK